VGGIHLSIGLRLAAVTALGVLVATTVGRAQLADTFFDAVTHPAIGYLREPPADAIARLARAIEDGTVVLTFDEQSGYLPALLDALDIPVESQLLVFSKTSLQSPLIDPGNPRAIFFNDATVVAWPRGGFIEIAAQDPQQGTMFYLLPQSPACRRRHHRARGSPRR